MQRRSIIGALIILGAALFAVSVIAVFATQPAAAQCGSQASSCKNCHETQAKLPVNADGTGWHQSHAFGDFCYICHGGNSQATEAEAAHTGMVAPMSDVQAACAQCHPNDLQARSDVYTVALGIPASQPNAPAAAASPAAAAVTSETAAAPVAPAAPLAAAPASVPNDPNMVDYVARYNQEVLHQQPTNWGNVVLILILLGMLAVGVFLINRREGWISISFTEKKAVGKEYTADALGIADQAEKLTSDGRKALARLLDRTAASDVLTALDKLSTDETSGGKN
jgi:hypothetical protein